MAMLLHRQIAHEHKDSLPGDNHLCISGNEKASNAMTHAKKWKVNTGHRQEETTLKCNSCWSLVLTTVQSLVLLKQQLVKVP